MKCIKAQALLLCTFLGWGVGHASVAKSIPSLLTEIETKYTQAGTLTAQFSQTTYDVALKKKKKSSGTILIRRPSRVRWETHTPDTNLLIGNGQKFWFYTPPFDADERGQVIEQKSSEVQSRLAQSLLSGEFSLNTDLLIQQKNSSTFQLTPKKGTAGTVETAVIEIKDKLIQKVILHHKGGNTAEITLSQIILGAPLNEALFIFTPPPNTDYVRP